MNEYLVRMWTDVRNRWHEVRSGERGATAVEYGIMVALIAAAIIAVVTVLGNETDDAFQKVVDGLEGTEATE
jgi:pilus assembly protein Flp/PilA